MEDGVYVEGAPRQVLAGTRLAFVYGPGHCTAGLEVEGLFTGDGGEEGAVCYVLAL